MTVPFASARKKSKKSPRSWKILVRFTQEERKVLAQRKGKLSFSDYVRQAALSRKLPSQPPAINRETYKLLLNVSANLNQLTKVVNSLSKQGKPIAGLDFALLGELQKSVLQIRSDLSRTSHDELPDASDEVGFEL